MYSLHVVLCCKQMPVCHCVLKLSCRVCHVILILMYHTLLQSVGAAEAVSWQGLYWMVCHCLPSSSWGRNLKFLHDLPALHEGDRGIFNVHQLMPAAETLRLTSI